MCVCACVSVLCVCSVEYALELYTFKHHSVSYAAPFVWNSLPHEIRPIQSTAAFKAALKAHMFKTYYF